MRRTKLYKAISVVALSAVMLGGCAANTADSESYLQTTKESVNSTQPNTQISSYDIHSDTNYDTPAHYLEPHDGRLSTIQQYHINIKRQMLFSLMDIVVSNNIPYYIFCME